MRLGTVRWGLLLLFAAVTLLPWQAGTNILRQTVSEMAWGPFGWLVAVAFGALGVSMLFSSDRLTRWTGLGLLGIALWPLTLSLELHRIAAWPTLVLMAFAVYRANRAVGLIAALLVAALMISLGPLGLVERVLFALWLSADVLHQESAGVLGIVRLVADPDGRRGVEEHHRLDVIP